MTTRQLDTELLNSGEPRHYGSWQVADIPRLRRQGDLSAAEAVYQRQKMNAPRVRLHGLTQLLRILRF